MVDAEEVRRIADNARLALTDDEVDRFAAELDSILEAFASLDDIDTDDVDPAFHPVDLDEQRRGDEPEASLGQETATANSANTEDGYFVGPRST
jgi:aspartyl-tRNA(Asn)/glutamyl-tRNA(Gln) amidotransferase subunit C